MDGLAAPLEFFAAATGTRGVQVERHARFLSLRTEMQASVHYGQNSKFAGEW